MSKMAFIFRLAGAAFLVVMGVALASCGEDGRGAACSPACAAGLMCCPTASGAAFCQATQSNTQHCGMCGNVCDPGQLCMSGVCVAGGDGGTTDSTVSGDCSPTCSSEQRCCGTTCVNRMVPAGTDGRSDSSFMNCNGCGIACEPDRASACTSEGCVCGAFAQCIVGETCVNEGGTFRCVNTQTDRNNCGEVGNVCPGEEICVSGVCSCGSTGAACPTGQTCCGGACIDTETDPMNCGGCGTVCGANGPTCVAGSCQCGSSPACREPTTGDVGESCCDDACVANTTSNCGCGVMCEDGDECIYSDGSFPGTPVGVCCGTSFGGLGGFCSDLSGGDGGFSLDGGFFP